MFATRVDWERALDEAAELIDRLGIGSTHTRIAKASYIAGCLRALVQGRGYDEADVMLLPDDYEIIVDFRTERTARRLAEKLRQLQLPILQSVTWRPIKGGGTVAIRYVPAPR